MTSHGKHYINYNHFLTTEDLGVSLRIYNHYIATIMIFELKSIDFFINTSSRLTD